MTLRLRYEKDHKLEQGLQLWLLRHSMAAERRPKGHGKGHAWESQPDCAPVGDEFQAGEGEAGDALCVGAQA